MKIYNDDCMNLEIPKCRLLLTDIPYAEVNINETNSNKGIRDLDKGKADILTFDLMEWLDHIYNSFEICIIFCGIQQFPIIYNYFMNKKSVGGGE